MVAIHTARASRMGTPIPIFRSHKGRPEMVAIHPHGPAMCTPPNHFPSQQGPAGRCLHPYHMAAMGTPPYHFLFPHRDRPRWLLSHTTRAGDGYPPITIFHITRTAGDVCYPITPRAGQWVPPHNHFRTHGPPSAVLLSILQGWPMGTIGRPGGMDSKISAGPCDMETGYGMGGIPSASRVVWIAPYLGGSLWYRKWFMGGYPIGRPMWYG